MATYQAELNQIVQVTTNTEANTITAPASPQQGHWFEVKLAFGFSGFLTTIVPAGTESIEDADGKGFGSLCEIGFGWESIRFVYLEGLNAWAIRRSSKPTAVPELFDKVGTTLLGTDTPIPLVYDTTFQINPTYFSVNGGNLECIRAFAGVLETRAYFELVFTANNQDAMGIVDLYVVSGTPQIVQGYGIAVAFQASRAGTWYMSGFNKAIAVVSVGDIIGLRGNDDPGQSGVTSVIEATGVIATSL